MYKCVVAALAQDAAQTERRSTREPTAADTRSPEIQRQREELRDRMRRVIRLPRTTQEAREEGAIYEISSDPELSKAYNAALE
jgi:hypothetical protein